MKINLFTKMRCHLQFIINKQMYNVNIKGIEKKNDTKQNF